MLPILLLALPQVGTTRTVVTAPRSERPATTTDASATVVTGEELRATGERSLPRALGLAAGVWIQETNLGGGAPFLRGLVGNRVLILVDGIRQNDSTTREGPNQILNGIDPAIVDRIEVLRGPASVLYGSDAIGGTILIWTRRRTPAPEGSGLPRGPRGSVDLLYRSAAEGGRVAVSGSEATRKDGLLAILGGQSWGDLRAGGGERQPFTGYSGGSAFGAWEHAMDPTKTIRFTARLDRQDDVPRTDRLVPGFGQTQPSNEEWNFKVQERSVFQGTYDDRAPGVLGDRLQVRFAAGGTLEEREIQGFGSSILREERDQVDTLELGIDVRRTAGEDHLLTFGVDFKNDRVDSQRVDVDVNTGVVTPNEGQFAPDASYSTLGAFVQDEVFALEPFDLTAGLRFTYVDFGFDPFPSQGGTVRTTGSFPALTASLASGVDVASGVRVTGTVAQGFRAPNLDDLAKNGSFAGGVELANPDLDPEQSLMLELALAANRETFDSGLSVHFNTLSDLIGRVLVNPGNPGVPGDETYLRENVGRASIYGVEAHHRQWLSAGSPFSVEGLLAWTRGRQFDKTVDPNTGLAPFDDVPFRRIPPLHGRIGLRWDASDGPLGALGWARLDWIWAAAQTELHPQDVTDPRIDPDGTPGWSVVNLDVGGPIPGLGSSSWALGVHNLLDLDYRVHGSGIDGPGLGLVVGLHVAN